MNMGEQLGLFGAAPKASKAPDPWAWHPDFTGTHHEDGIRAWYCNPKPGVWLEVEFDRLRRPPYRWEVQGGPSGAAKTREEAEKAARESVG